MKSSGILNLIGETISYLSVIIIVWGTFASMLKFFKVQISGKEEKEKVYKSEEIRSYLASYILLGLEVLIAADIIETIAKPEIKEVLTLITIVIIRTFISYFLQREISSLEKFDGVKSGVNAENDTNEE